MKKILFLTLIFLILSAVSAFCVEKKVSVHNDGNFNISLSFRLMDTCCVYDQLLTIKSGNAIICSFIVEQVGNELFYITNLSSQSLSRHYLRFKPDTLLNLYNIDFLFNQMGKTCLLQTCCDTLAINNIYIPVANISLISFPSANNVEVGEFEVMDSSEHYEKFGELKYILIFLLVDIVIFLVIHLKKTNVKKENAKDSVVIKHKKYLNSTGENSVKSSISLFGKFTVFDKEGKDISSKFSPILREILFLLICNTKSNGISSEKLKELLWLDKTEQSATNNRSVYFNKLRNLMKDVGDFKLISYKGFWKIETLVSIDYFSFLEIINKRTISKEDIITLLEILDNGKFLGGFEEQWADGIKSDVSDSIISILSNYLIGFNIKSDSDFAIQICDAIFNFDSLNEIALNFKCKAYKEKGNHTLAKLIYNNYSKDYLALYGEEYSKSFSDIFYL